MVVVSTNGRQDTEESVVLGMDFSPSDRFACADTCTVNVNQSNIVTKNNYVFCSLQFLFHRHGASFVEWHTDPSGWWRVGVANLIKNDNPILLQVVQMVFHSFVFFTGDSVCLQITRYTYSSLYQSKPCGGCLSFFGKNRSSLKKKVVVKSHLPSIYGTKHCLLFMFCYIFYYLFMFLHKNKLYTFIVNKIDWF